MRRITLSPILMALLLVMMYISPLNILDTEISTLVKKNIKHPYSAHYKTQLDEYHIEKIKELIEEPVNKTDESELYYFLHIDKMDLKDHRPIFVYDVKTVVRTIIGTPPPPSGDWIISDTTIVEDSTLIINGSIIVESSGVLILRNSSIFMNLTSDGEHYIDVYGNLTVLNSLITAYNTSNNYYMRIFDGAQLYIAGSEISYAGYEIGSCGQHSGVWINTDNVTIINTTIHHNFWGCFLQEATNITISNCTIRDDVSGGVRVNDSQKVLVEYSIMNNNSGAPGIGVSLASDLKVYNCTMINNTYGVYFTQSSDSLVTRCVMSNKYWSMILKTSSNISVINNTVDGIYLQYSDNNTMAHNYIPYSYIYVYYSDYNKILNNIVEKGCEIRNSYHLNITNNTFKKHGLFIDGTTSNNYVENNTVNGKPLIYVESQQDIIIGETECPGQVILVGCTNITVIDANTSYINVGMELLNTQNTTIKNCLILNNTFYGVYIRNSHDIKVLNCTITNTSTGIYLYNSNGSTIEDSTIENCDEYGVYMQYSNNTTLRSNKLSACKYGFHISDAINCSVEENSIKNCYEGITLGDCQNIDITGGNNIYNNNWGMRLNGINISVTRNIIHNNTEYGIYIEYTNYTKIFGNKIFNNNYGLYIENSNYGEISRNNISLNMEATTIVSSQHSQIYANNISLNTKGCTISDSQYMRVYDNYIDSNENFGVYLTGNTSYVQIYNNTIIRTRGYGVIVYCSESYGFHEIFQNNFINNSAYGIAFMSVSGVSTVYLNNFMGDKVLDLSANRFDNGSYGNYWSFLQINDSDHDWLGDEPYCIDEDTNDSKVLVYRFEAYIYPNADFDSDNLTNYEERGYGTNPFSPDTDNDGLSDYYEVSIDVFDPLDPDIDDDGMPDGWEVAYGFNATDPTDATWDNDSDGLLNVEEYQHGTDPFDMDTDDDGIPDQWEVHYGLNPINSSDAMEDYDDDGLPNLYEYEYNTSPLNPDTDGDNITDDWEVNNGLDPLNPNDSLEDFDGDSLTNFEEYMYDTNPLDLDTDGDGILDYWEIQNNLNALDASDAQSDPDNDGLNNLAEYQYDTNPWSNDTDTDGIPDPWEITNNLDPLNGSDALLDNDNDGLSNLQEYEFGTDPSSPDTDLDGLPDYWEITNELDPLNSSDSNLDLDEDNLSNIDEYLHKTDIWDPDTDDDGIPDGWEVKHGLDPNDKTDAKKDNDNDGLTNLEEYIYGTDPNDPDSDNDGFSDLDETIAGTDPLNPRDHPTSFQKVFYTLFIAILILTCFLIIVAVLMKPKEIENIES